MKKNRKSELIRKFSAASAWVRKIRKPTESNRAGAVGAVVEDLGCKVLAVLHHEVVLFGQEVLAVDDLDEVADGTTTGSFFYFLDSLSPEDVSSFPLKLIADFLQLSGSLEFKPPDHIMLHILNTNCARIQTNSITSAIPNSSGLMNESSTIWGTMNVCVGAKYH